MSEEDSAPAAGTGSAHADPAPLSAPPPADPALLSAPPSAGPALLSAPPPAAPPSTALRILLLAAACFGAAIVTAGVRSLLPNGIAELSLYGAPVLFGVLAAVVRPDKPVRIALLVAALGLAGGAAAAGEGALCGVVIAPIVLVHTVWPAALIGWLIRRRRVSRGGKAALLALALLLNGLASTLDRWRIAASSGDRVTFADGVIIDAPRALVWSSLEHLTLDYKSRAPWLVRAALPTPLRVEGDGASPGSRRRVVFSNGTVIATVVRAQPLERFDVELRAEASGPEFFDHWCQLERSSFLLEPLPGGRTQVSHVTTYRPLAYPRWYFAPLERALGSLIQGYMLEAYADALKANPRLLAEAR